jgi:drug/metabolite transporter (DMT)-like permease
MDLSLQALKKVSAFTQNLTLNLEPVYGIVLAFIIYNEQKELSSTFYYGFALIILSVVFQMARIAKRKSN